MNSIKYAVNGLIASTILISQTTLAAQIRIDGFISVVGGMTVNDKKLANGKESTYVTTPVFINNSDKTPNENARYDDSFSFLPESNLGIQIHSDVNEKLSATAQLTAHGANDFDAELEWAYASYSVDESWTLVAGRQRIPLYMYSSYLDVGFAYHWLRPPVELYGEGVSAYTGLSVKHSTDIAGWDLKNQIYYGNAKNSQAALGNVELENLVGIVISA
ncbi:hypothetical protein KCM76_20840 [Zooshikella marina]|uniref:hypothetical protein n=1 Tax=Zooshikella ganghwensis TaxID=202772 RepID=UPI001BAFA8F9|nr:hypothetical protein [Zooshikella ganghwensis]MBU2708453.1 hypothetical protein [Zooshikella ganghwensis]